MPDFYLPYVVSTDSYILGKRVTSSDFISIAIKK